MGKPRLIIIIRHAQSEGNKNREIHQTVPDHRVKLTPEGWKQAEEAGRKLRALLHPTDTLHFFTSPYRRARETTEGILRTLTAPSPFPSSAPPSSSSNNTATQNSTTNTNTTTTTTTTTTTPSPFPRSTIKVHEEPRLREQDFGNFQPSSGAMAKMWQERADYGHFFYRIPNGESAADAYDRISGFNESLWRSWADDEKERATVQVLVTHGLMTRVFLMKWYHFSVEYFEDLRNVEHCEFVVMKLEGGEHGEKGKGKYRLQNQLRTWSGLRRERAEKEAREKFGAGGAGGGDEAEEVTSPQSPIPVRKRWGGCQDANDVQEQEERSGVGFQRRQQMRRRQNTADLFRDDEELVVREEKAGQSSDEEEQLEADLRPGVEASSHKSPRDRLRFLRAGRDGGGSHSGAGSPDESEDEKNAGLKKGGAMAMALSGKLDGRPSSKDRARADALGDQSDIEDEEEEKRENVKGGDEVEKLQWLEKSVDSSVR